MIVHYFGQRRSNGTAPPSLDNLARWGKQGEQACDGGALTLARVVAGVHGNPAWLPDESGYRLKPIEARPAA